MKKVLSVLVILGFVIGMAACGNKKAEEEARIQDSIEQARIADSIEQVRVQDSIAQAILELQMLAEQEAAEAEEAGKTPAKKTTVKEVTPADQPKTRGGATKVDE